MIITFIGQYFLRLHTGYTKPIRQFFHPISKNPLSASLLLQFKASDRRSVRNVRLGRVLDFNFIALISNYFRC